MGAQALVLFRRPLQRRSERTLFILSLLFAYVDLGTDIGAAVTFYRGKETTYTRQPGGGGGGSLEAVVRVLSVDHVPGNCLGVDLGDDVGAAVTFYSGTRRRRIF